MKADKKQDKKQSIIIKNDPKLKTNEQEIFNRIKSLQEESYLELIKRIRENKARIQKRIDQNKKNIIKSNANRQAKIQIISTFEQMLSVIKKELETNCILKYHETISKYYNNLSEIIDSLAQSCKLKKEGKNKYKSNTHASLSVYHLPERGEIGEIEVRRSKISSQEDALKIVHKSNLFKDLLGDMKNNIEPIVNRIKKEQEKENQPPPFVFNESSLPLQVVDNQKIAITITGDFI